MPTRLSRLLCASRLVALLQFSLLPGEAASAHPSEGRRREPPAAFAETVSVKVVAPVAWLIGARARAPADATL
jgi:hypothetical protein